MKAKNWRQYQKKRRCREAQVSDCKERKNFKKDIGEKIETSHLSCVESRNTKHIDRDKTQGQRLMLVIKLERE